MNASFFDRARAERFAQLLDEANGARRHHARSHLDGELSDLVATGKRLQAMRLNGAPTSSFKQELRAQLLATAEREGIGVTARSDSGARPRNVFARPRLIPVRPRARGAIVVGVAAGTLALSGVSVASGDAIPGDTLYGMKRSTERAQLALAGSDLSRGQLHLEFARTRLQEADAVSGSEADFVTALQEMDSETRLGIRMLITSAMTQHDTTALDAIDRFVGGQRGFVARLLDRGHGERGRQQVTRSLELLTTVEDRSKAARAALACGGSPVGADPLGPVPGACATLKNSVGATGPGPIAGRPEQHHPMTTSSTPAAAPSPAASPTAVPEAEQKDEGLLTELGRLLGGLLGS